MYGTIRSAWEIKDNRFTLRIAVPVNIGATVYVPRGQKAAADSPASVYRADDVRFLRLEDKYAVFEAQSGTYEFTSDLTP